MGSKWIKISIMRNCIKYFIIYRFFVIRNKILLLNQKEVPTEVEQDVHHHYIKFEQKILFFLGKQKIHSLKRETTSN